MLEPGWQGLDQGNGAGVGLGIEVDDVGLLVWSLGVTKVVLLWTA